MANKDLLNTMSLMTELPLLLVGDNEGIIFDRDELLTDGIQRGSNFIKTQFCKTNKDLLDAILTGEPIPPVSIFDTLRKVGGNNMDGIQETYAIAYADKNGNGFSNSEPWVMAQFGDDIEECKTKAMELVNEGYKKVIPFQFGKELLESYSWEYVRMNRIEI